MGIWCSSHVLWLPEKTGRIRSGTMRFSYLAEFCTRISVLINLPNIYHGPRWFFMVWGAHGIYIYIQIPSRKTSIPRISPSKDSFSRRWWDSQIVEYGFVPWKFRKTSTTQISTEKSRLKRFPVHCGRIFVRWQSCGSFWKQKHWLGKPPTQ